MSEPKIQVQKSIFLKLQQDVRVPAMAKAIKKTGYNNHLGYYYYSLDDILPVATKLIADAGLCTIFNIAVDQNGIEVATLTLTDGIDRIPFTIPTANVPRQEGIFETGSKNTYCKRYLYMNLLELADPDVAEMTNTGEKTEAKKETVEDKKATPKQVEMIRGLYDEENIGKMIEYYGINSLDELTLKQASEVIKRKTGK